MASRTPLDSPFAAELKFCLWNAVWSIAVAVSGYRLGRHPQKEASSRFSVGLILTISLILTGCDLASSEKVRETGGDYGPVTHDMLAGATLTSRTGRDRRYDDLQWSFQENTFQIQAGEHGLPPVLAESLLPAGIAASEISGQWSVADDVITFTEITADGEIVDQPPRTLPTMFTGVLRIEAGPQYKFSRSSTSRQASPGTTTTEAN